MKTLKGFIGIMRIPEQVIYIVPYLFGILASNFRDYQTIFYVGLGLVFLGISAFMVNEYIDSFDTDSENDRNKAPLDFKKYKLPILGIATFFGIMGGLIFIYYELFVALILLLIFGFLYSIPPVRFKGRFPWDMVANLIAAGFVPYSLGFNLNNLPYDVMLTSGFIVLACLGFCFQGIHELADAEADKKAGLNTWATVLGYHNFLRILDKVAILGLLAFAYMVYRHESWWLYPTIIILAYQLLVIGYARAAIYQPDLKRLHSIGKRSFPIGAMMLIAIMIFQIWALTQPINLLP